MSKESGIVSEGIWGFLVFHEDARDKDQSLEIGNRRETG